MTWLTGGKEGFGGDRSGAQRAVLRARMVQGGEGSDETKGAIGDEVRALVEDAGNFADESTEPPLEALTEDIYVDTTSDSTTSSVEGAR